MRVIVVGEENINKQLEKCTIFDSTLLFTIKIFLVCYEWGLNV